MLGVTSAADLVGRTLAGRYFVRSLIGEGGMGAVYEADQTDLRRRVALKVLLSVDSRVDPRSTARLRQEAMAAAALRSPHVVTVFDFIATPGEPPILVMELLEGETLASLLRREGRLPLARAVAIARQMLDGLASAHGAGMVHRDVKPSNVWIARSPAGDLVKLLDFGIAKVREDMASVRTTTGTILGTPAYLAPEQILATTPTPATDVHAVSTVLFEMLTGERPYRADGTMLSVEILSAPPPSVRLAAPDVPEVVDALVRRGLAKEAASRPTIAELGAALAASLAGQASPIAARPSMSEGHAAPVVARPSMSEGHVVSGAGASTPPPRPRIWVGVAAALVVVVVGLIALWRLMPVLMPTPSKEATTHGTSSPSEVPSPSSPSAEMTSSSPSSPSPSAPSPSASAETAAPSRATSSGPALAPSCLCMFRTTGTFERTLCAKAMVPRCSCQFYGDDMCKDPVRDGACQKTQFLPGARGGDACVGYAPRGGSQPIDGELHCSRCYDVKPRAAVAGARCSGFDVAGEAIDGVWRCGI